jgi:hypothetical protein
LLLLASALLPFISPTGLCRPLRSFIGPGRKAQWTLPPLLGEDAIAESEMTQFVSFVSFVDCGVFCNLLQISSDML